jgi:TolA-binding protein
MDRGVWDLLPFLPLHIFIAPTVKLAQNEAVGARRFFRAFLGVAAFIAAATGALLSPRAAAAEDPADVKAFGSAAKMFQDGHYALAATNFTTFLDTFTNSTHRGSAILYLAQCQLNESNGIAAIDLLQKSFPSAGDLKPQYVFWIAKARLSERDYTNAAAGFANVARIPDSPQRLEAAYDEALTYSEIPDWPRVVELLQASNSVFRVASALEPASPFSVFGPLLLSEAFLNEYRYQDAEKTALALDTRNLDPDLAWRRQFLLCRIKLAGGHPDDALTQSTNLVAIASGPAHRAASVYLQGQILENLGRPSDALQVYEQNLADGVPTEERQRTVAKIVELTVALNAPTDAIQLLSNVVSQLAQTPGADLARVSLGELYLKAFVNPSNGVGTNALALALTNFNTVILAFTNSPWLPKAHLDRGWCDWLRDNFADAKTDFDAAARGLPNSEDQAVALFKLGDADFAVRDFTGAVSNYNLLLRRYDNMQSVTNSLFARALYQIIESEINLNDDAGAQAAAETILRWYPDSYFGDRGLLLVGENLDQKNSNARARQIFMDLLKRSSNSTLATQVEFAVARSYDHEGDWKDAIPLYDRWVSEHPSDRQLPEVEFYRALANAKAGLETNALAMFTNYVSYFPGNTFTPWAQNWVADYYFNHQSYQLAEFNYQEVYQKLTNTGDLAYQARFWAGRAAAANQELADARQNYFSALVNDTNTPTALAQQSIFALADIAFQQFQANPLNETNLTDAIAAVSKLTNGAPTNAISIEALGRLGDYYKLYANLKSDTNVYAKAAQMYSTVLSYPATASSISARSQAEVGLGLIAEREGLPDQALAHYSHVLYGYDPAHFDAYWVESAGEGIARICENRHQWDQAVNTYRRVLEAVPSLRPALEKRIEAAQSQADAARN